MINKFILENRPEEQARMDRRDKQTRRELVTELDQPNTEPRAGPSGEQRILPDLEDCARQADSRGGNFQSKNHANTR